MDLYCMTWWMVNEEKRKKMMEIITKITVTIVYDTRKLYSFQFVVYLYNKTFLCIFHKKQIVKKNIIIQ